jgi:hypothetical protein
MLSVPLQRAHLSFDRASQRWWLLGWNASGDIASATGLVGQDTVANLQWKRPEPEDVRVALISGTSSEVLALESTMRPGHFGVNRRVSVLWSLTDHGSSAWMTTRLVLQCGPLSTRGEAALCAAFDGTRTRLFEVNPVTRRLRALASVDGLFFRGGQEGSGWIAGSSGLGSILLRTASGTAIRVDGRDGSHAAGDLAMADNVIGAVFWSEHGSTVRLYDRDKVGVPLR